MVSFLSTCRAHSMLAFGATVFMVMGFSSTSAQAVIEQVVTIITSEPQMQQWQVVEPPPTTSAAAWAVFEVASGRIIMAHNGDAVRPIASLTKLPVAAVVRQWEESPAVPLLMSDIAAHGTAGLLERGQEYTPRELLYPLLLVSSNDAAAALDRLSDKTLLTDMAELAKQAGVPQSTFADTSGLSDENVSTAADIARLTTYLFTSDPKLFTLTTLKTYLGPYHGWQNNSPVFDLHGYRGGKHGYTDAAGRTLVALFDESVAGSVHTFGYVLLGSNNLRRDTEVLRTFVAESVELQ